MRLLLTETRFLLCILKVLGSPLWILPGSHDVKKDAKLSLATLLMIFVLALLARLLVAGHGAQLATATHDAHSEMIWIARNLAADRGFSYPFGPGDKPTAWFSPLLPFLWAAIIKVAGEGEAFLKTILYVNALVSALSVLIYARIYRAIAPPRARTGVCMIPVMAVLCLWPPALMLTTATWYYCWQELGIALLFLALLKWKSSDFSFASSAAVALCAGLAAYINPSILLVLVAAVGFHIVAGRQRSRAVTGGATIILILALLMLPWTIRNYRVLHKVVPMRSNFAVEFQQGNNPQGSIRQTLDSVHPALSAVERTAYDRLGEAEYTGRAMAKTITYIADNPLLTVRRSLCRAYVFWCSDILDAWPWVEREKWWRSGPGVQAWWVGKIAVHNLPWILALVTVLAGRWRPLGEKWLPALHVLLFPLPYYLTHCSPEYAYPVQPYLLVFAGAAICGHLTAARTGTREA